MVVIPGGIFLLSWAPLVLASRKQTLSLKRSFIYESLTRMRLLVLLLSVTAAAQTQRAPLEPKPVYGSVSGTVTCTDTNLPARLTPVTLQPVTERVPAKEGDPKRAEPLLETFQTRLDGTFTIPHLRTGKYYVIVQKPGYLSPTGLFTKAEMDWPANPADDVSDAVEKAVPVVTITASRESQVEVHLVRAAAVTGTVKFDDGTPAPSQYITVQRKGPKGTWLSTNLGGRRGNGWTDDQGRFRIAGMPAGEYRLFTSLEVGQVVTTAIFGTNASSSGNTKANLNVFFGDTFRRKEAKIYKLEDGQEITADLTIPNSKLHQVSGSLVDARSGRPINAGTVRLTFADDAEQSIASVAVDNEEPVFSLPFVPEGTYTVSVTDARDVTRVPVVYPEGTIATAEFKETVLKSYGKYEGTLNVQADATGIVLAIPAKALP